MADKNNHFFRAEKTTRGNDDFKVLMVGISIALSLLVAPLFTSKITEYRWFRDLARLTPFYNVQLYYASVIEEGTTIVVGGTLTKRRCDFDTSDLVTNPVAYVSGQYGQRHRVEVDTSVEDMRGVSGNRPPSDSPESWGPWSISIEGLTVFGEPLVPQEWDIQVFHVNCPSNPVNQANEFISGNWGDFELERPISTPEEEE